MTDEFKPKKLVRARDAARLLGVSERWVWFRIKEGTLPAVRLKGTTRISLSDLEQFVETGKQPRIAN